MTAVVSLRKTAALIERLFQPSNIEIADADMSDLPRFTSAKRSFIRSIGW